MAWKSKAKDRLRDLLGNARGKNKRPSWIDILGRYDLTERFSRSKYLKELQEQKKGEYVDFRTRRFWEKFHEVRKKAKQDAEALGTSMPDDLQLIPL
ncbi:hypothetical protein M9H77_31445 [Catharanthus roseus]|uniref:Uncharacterized protein n=1 Tax=Catharanthus roseus TaxID=4058 RepID=A0ACC0A2H2_CATRO|nr:hypothetical protein M9H77_31445 [Catharanthus roseus]